MADAEKRKRLLDYMKVGVNKMRLTPKSIKIAAPKIDINKQRRKG